MYRHGWYQIAFARELAAEVSAAAASLTRLVVLQTQAGLRVADAVCPHRGANLAFGGRFADDTLVCPFHGFHIGLGEPSKHGFCVREYRTLVAGGLVFVRLSNDHDNGFASVMEKLVGCQFIVPGFTLKVRSSAEMVIENAFDQAHFGPVHGIATHGAFRMRPSERGTSSRRHVRATAFAVAAWPVGIGGRPRSIPGSGV